MTTTRLLLVASTLYLALMAPALVFAQSLANADGVVHAGTDAKASSATAANAAHRKAEHTRIHQERAALAASRQKEEAVCYKRFAVEDCLREVRAKVREVENRLRAQEVELNDAERREKAADRLRAIEEKRNAAASGLATGKKGDAKVRKPSFGSRDLKTQHDQDALHRAQQQREHEEAQTKEQETRASANAERAAKTRERHAQTLKAADERRARVEKANADAAAQGHKAAAPLPVPDSPR